MFEIEALAKTMAIVVREHVDAAVAPLHKRIAELEAREPIPGPPGRDGIDGKDGSSVGVIEVVPLIEDAVGKAVSALPVPKDGRDGTDGKSVSVDEVAPLITAEVERAVSSIPVPKDGAPGRDGLDGPSADDIAHLVRQAVAAIPAPRDGADGKDGRDGADVTGSFLDQEGNLVLTLSNGAAKNVGRVVGRDGAPGKDGAPGRDGFGLKDFDADLMDDGRTVRLKFDDGSDISFAVELGFPTMIYRGVYREGEYQKGDTVTYGGSLWHCNQDGTTQKPDDGSKAWTLAAKRGRDAREPAKV